LVRIEAGAKQKAVNREHFAANALKHILDIAAEIRAWKA